ncbi:hypothetical protein Poly51_42720 [Rubripirellula tenax]|uniref:Polysaccharide lyase 14 domain-containing protein n=1 Tax=Rubripirellula tenax TaxID=2528015 RepID=A0A5C6EU43_9BACT|nr:hypothetical protein [Rubripirellula tenax]TWU50979.1 hypothetical protein Poly51_42720 [Rubripirellula tenax]
MSYKVSILAAFVCLMTDAVLLSGTSQAAETQSRERTSVDQKAGTVLNNDFSDEAVGVYTDDDFKSDRDWGDVRWAHFDDRAEIVLENGDKKLRLTFPKGQFGHAKTGGNAAISFDPHSEIFQRFTVRFEPGFSFVKTGKIVGLGSGGASWTGGNVPREGQGYSSRFIWDRDNAAAMYLYHMDQRGKWGDVVDLGFKFETGTDYTLTQRVSANTANKKNGILQVWVSENGGPQRRVIDRSDLRFGTNGRGKTETLFVAPFHGGGDSSFAAKETSYLTVDDFLVSTTKFSDLP